MKTKAQVEARCSQVLTALVKLIETPAHTKTAAAKDMAEHARLFQELMTLEWVLEIKDNLLPNTTDKENEG